MPRGMKGLVVKVPMITDHIGPVAGDRTPLEHDVWVNICCEEVQFATQEFRMGPEPAASASSADRPALSDALSEALLYHLQHSGTGYHRHAANSTYVPPEPKVPLRTMATRFNAYTYSDVAKAKAAVEPPTFKSPPTRGRIGGIVPMLRGPRLGDVGAVFMTTSDMERGKKISC